MKYLKKFNESVSKEQIESLKELCDNYLAYLTDDGFFTLVQNSTYKRNSNKLSNSNTFRPKDTFLITIKNMNRFKWENVKDYILPLLQILETEGYIITHNKINFRISQGIWHDMRRDYNLEDLLSDNLEDDNLEKYEILKIQLRVRI